MGKRFFSLILLTLLASGMCMSVLDAAVKQVKAVVDPWKMPVIYLQPIFLGPSTLRVNVAIYNLTNTFYPTDEAWVEGGPLPPISPGPAARYNYSLGNLYAFDISFCWNPAVLSYVRHEKTVPRGTAPQAWRSKGILNSQVLLASDDVNPVAGTYRIGYASLYPAAPFNALGDAANVFTMTFDILGAGDFGLDITSASLAVDAVSFPDAQPVIPWRAVLHPDSPHNVGVEAAPRNKDVVGERRHFDTFALVKNTGATSETFNVTLYARATPVGVASTIIAAGTAQTVKIPCSTAGLAKGTYTIKAVATTVDGETYLADNELIQSTIFITLVGDIDGNRVVNIFDIVKFAGSFGACLPSPGYNPYCDTNNDGCVNLFDLVPPAMNFGSSW